MTRIKRVFVFLGAAISYGAMSAAIAGSRLDLCQWQPLRFTVGYRTFPGVTESWDFNSNDPSICFSNSGMEDPCDSQLIVEVTADEIGDVVFGIWIRITQFSQGTVGPVCDVENPNRCLVWRDDDTGQFINPTFDVVAHKVDSVSMEVGEPFSFPLSDNPNLGGGKRIFPGKLFPEDDVELRRKVKVTAHVAVADGSDPSDLSAWFGAYDVDDPTTDGRPIDTNCFEGYDNRGQPNNGEFVGGSASSTRSSLTINPDSSGNAEAEFKVSMQPGDNFKIAASCYGSIILQSEAVGTDIVDQSTTRLVPFRRAPNEIVQVTDMLTVWRHLWIESDSMQPVDAQNSVTGLVVGATSRSQGTILDLSFDGPTGLLRSPFERDRFVDGQIQIGPSVLDILGSAGTTVTVNPLIVGEAFIGQPFVLFDDDDIGNNDLVLDGDFGETIPLPDLSLLQSSDNPDENVLAPAFINPLQIDNGPGDVPFMVNLPGDSRGETTVADLQAIYAFDNVAHENDPNFWIVYLLSAYQGGTSEDCDPDPKNGCIVGVSDVEQGGVVFVADLAEAPDRWPGATEAHEIGHVLNADHGDGALMSRCGDRENCVELDEQVPAFSEDSLEAIRSTVSP